MPETDFDNGEVQEVQPQSAKDVDGIPYCKKHHVRMEKASGGKKGAITTYFRCPVDNCDCRAQILRVKRESVVPKNPVTCPRCKGVVCERDDRISNAQSVTLKCPRCEWRSTPLATPQFANLRETMNRQPVEELGAR